jgi:hypothetical protein
MEQLDLQLIKLRDIVTDKVINIVILYYVIKLI